MNKILKQTLLYDFYGELLTEHQRDIYEQFVLEDFSLGEIAGEKGISRQGVYDIVKRCRMILEEYERRLHLVEKFLSIKSRVEELNQMIDLCIEKNMQPKDIAGRIHGITDKIIEEL